MNKVIQNKVFQKDNQDCTLSDTLYTRSGVSL